MLKIELLEEKYIVVDEETGEILSKSLEPKFEGYDYYENWKDDGLRFLEPMTCQTIEKLETCGIDFSHYIAEQKFDGHRCLGFFTPKGNRFFSRRISKKTSWYSENSDCMPHLRDFKVPMGNCGTVIDGELLMPTGEFADVQGVTGALPENAIKKQVECGCAILNAFDILYYKGINVQKFPLWKRKLFLYSYLKQIKCPNIIMAPAYYTVHSEGIEMMERMGIPCIKVESLISLRDEMWEKGLEGLVIKEIESPYEQKRSKNWLKVKECLTFDVVIMGYQEPTMLYDGKTLAEKGFWDFWMDAEDEHIIVCKRMSGREADEQGLMAVTKPYAMDWIGAIICGLYKDGELVATTEVKGITDKNQELIRTHKNELLGKVIEVKAQGIIDKEKCSLRHPRFNRWREDKSAEMCRWEEFGI